MTSHEFALELQAIDPRFTVVENANNIGLSNIFFEGKNYDLPVISTSDIRDEVDQSYRFEFANGMRARFWTKSEILGRIEDFLQKVKAGQIDNSLYAD